MARQWGTARRGDSVFPGWHVATTGTISGQAATTLLHWLERKLHTSKEPQPQFQLFTVNNYITDLINGEKSGSFVDRVYHAEQENELLFALDLGSKIYWGCNKRQAEIAQRDPGVTPPAPYIYI